MKYQHANNFHTDSFTAIPSQKHCTFIHSSISRQQRREDTFMFAVPISCLVGHQRCRNQCINHFVLVDVDCPYINYHDSPPTVAVDRHPLTESSLSSYHRWLDQLLGSDIHISPAR